MTEATDRPKVMVIFGTRPEAIKMAPVIRALNDSPLRSIVVVTGQHRDMLDQVLQLFAIHPDYDLAIMRHGQTLSDVTVRVLTGLEEVLERENPDLVLVHGDTTTAMASALASYYHRIPVGHVEAGLRTEHPYNPFPEEMNRRLISRIAALHFAPTETAKQNLVRENVSPSSIYVTGNTVIDALVSVIRSDYRFRDPELARIVALPGRMLLVTAHRRENLGAPMVRIFRALREILSRFADTRVVFPMHKNPAVRHLIKQELGMLERVHLVEPPEYEEFANLMNRAFLILTDSGGIQEEAPALGKPVLVLRDTTERPEGIAAGTLRKVGTATSEIVAAASELLTDTDAYSRMACTANPYGDGKAAQRIVGVLQVHLFRGS
ncbi:MAG: UDP-N-acetylglucosamine 2-epimerase (non-hydrolyzing) [Firmicutes bacterium]|jgi:UDP-N-acetylglucosamine 2-epimerase (non-hydrolysing)|nr:UDP-N-acetylglucosamine 2-epimerase (non-hydrolyzing) [Bacillota bacterium]